MDENDGDLREEIVRLEADIEQFAETIESCRKLILIAKAAMALGALLILGALIGAITLDPAVLIGAFGVAIGGLVVFGSNRSPLGQAQPPPQAAARRRYEVSRRIQSPRGRCRSR